MKKTFFDLCVVTRKLGNNDTTISAIIIRNFMMSETQCKNRAREHIEDLICNYPEFKTAVFNINFMSSINQ